MPSKSIYEARTLELVYEDGIYLLKRNNNQEGGRRYHTRKQAKNLLETIIHDYKQGKFPNCFLLKISSSLASELEHPELPF
ncbi:MAG: hypothetical protein ACP5D2_03910 [Candidatus Nanoarchaeia archaeon]